MPTYIGENKIIDRYLGDKFLEAAYIGDKKVYDPYTEITGTPSMIFKSRAAVAFKNYRIYGTAGGSGTAAGSGEPAGYKIPLTVTSGEQSTGYDLFIGNSKLRAEEYVDFSEQKIYKKTVNEFPYAEPGVFGFSEGTATVTSDGRGAFILDGLIPYEAESEKIPLKRDYIVPVSVGSGGAYTFYVGNGHRDYMRIVFYDAAGNELAAWQGNTVWRKSDSYQFSGTIHSVAFRNTKSGETSIRAENYTYAPMFSENSDLETYVPYLQPTDPPAPLPAVNIYKGENMLSSNETVGIVTVRGRIGPPYYKRVEYIRSTKTQIIVTDIVPTASNRYELDLQFTASEKAGGNRQFFGARKTQSDALYTVFACNWSGGGLEDQRLFTYMFNTATSAYTDISSTIKLNRNTLSLVGGSGTYGTASLAPVSTTMPTDIDLPLALFGITNGETANDTIIYTDSQMTLYGFKVYDGSAHLLHNLLPVEREDGELGLLDEITGKFYTNAGTGTFEKGDYI